MGIRVARKPVCFWTAETHLRIVALLCTKELMRGLGGLLDCLDAQHHVVCPVCVPPGRGDCLCVFASVFPPQCRGGI